MGSDVPGHPGSRHADQAGRSEPNTSRYSPAAAITPFNASAAAAWHALHGKYKINGLGYASGTKILYFAGYRSGCPGPRPLILDANVLTALHDAGTGFLASGGVRRADYLGYLNLASTWADHPAWPEGTPELAEYAQFERGRELNDLVARWRAGG